MFVEVADSAAGAPQLRACEDLGALSVHVTRAPADGRVLARALGAAAGDVAEDHAWLEVSWLRAAAGRQDQQWHDAFEAMLDHAAARGWLSGDRRRVRAHVDWGRTDEG